MYISKDLQVTIYCLASTGIGAFVLFKSTADKVGCQLSSSDFILPSLSAVLVYIFLVKLEKLFSGKSASQQALTVVSDYYNYIEKSENRKNGDYMIKKKIFLASSAELKDDRVEFELFIGRKNNALFDKGIHLEIVLWEDFLDAMSATRLQDEYNKAIQECDIFVMLFFTKVGKYTNEEFKTAFGQFSDNKKPKIFTYFKDSPISSGELNRNDANSLFDFKDTLNSLGHFPTPYRNIDDLKHHFSNQLEKLSSFLGVI